MQVRRRQQAAAVATSRATRKSQHALTACEHKRGAVARGARAAAVGDGAAGDGAIWEVASHNVRALEHLAQRGAAHGCTRKRARKGDRGVKSGGHAARRRSATRPWRALHSRAPSSGNRIQPAGPAGSKPQHSLSTCASVRAAAAGHGAAASAKTATRAASAAPTRAGRMPRWFSRWAGARVGAGERGLVG